MTDTQRTTIQKMRTEGIAVSQISAKTGLSENTIKSFCRRNNIRPVSNDSIPVVATADVCKFCGKPIEQKPHSKKKQFCSDSCRMHWWNTHPEQLNKRAVHQIQCAWCKKSFDAYSTKPRKYCSQDCYFTHRFGGA